MENDLSEQVFVLERSITSVLEEMKKYKEEIEKIRVKRTLEEEIIFLRKENNALKKQLFYLQELQKPLQKQNENLRHENQYYYGYLQLSHEIYTQPSPSLNY